MSRAVVLTGGVGHDFEATTGSLVQLLADESVSSLVIDEPAAAFARLSEPFELFVVNALWWRMLAERYDHLRADWAVTTPPEADLALATHLARGGGVLAMHTALICFDDWPGWGEALGASWDWHDDRSFHPPAGDVEVDLTDGDRLQLPDDEVYGFLEWHGPVEVLALGHHSGADHPVLWRRHHAGGRVAVDLLGHGPSSYADARHRALIRDLASWATTGCRT